MSVLRQLLCQIPIVPNSFCAAGQIHLAQQSVVKYSFAFAMLSGVNMLRW